jgi:hypothetical protein
MKKTGTMVMTAITPMRSVKIGSDGITPPNQDRGSPGWWALGPGMRAGE